ncbi:MAG: M55 family metallopeptidase [Planctomycetota bacterium]
MMGVDMEGITGITSREQTSTGGRLYAEGMELAVGDVNAAVEGLTDAGVDEIIVWDNHAGSFNHWLPKLHPGAVYRRGGAANRVRWAGLDDSVDGVILLGYHARAGTLHGVLEHTMSSASWFRLSVNGRDVGEIGIDGALAGAVGVGVIMVSGCEKLCAEAVDLFGADVVAVAVKKGHARHGATCLPPARTAEMIRAGAAEAVKRVGKVKPLDLGSPAVVELTYKHTEHADGADLRVFDGRRIDGYTVRWTCPDFASWMGFTAANPPPTGPGD